jgi:hypothetical protein
MIHISKNTKIYVLIPAGAETGGPEFLHQLVYYLRTKLHINTFFFSKINEKSKPIPNPYLIYQNPEIGQIEDEEINIIISPELGSMLKVMSGYKKIRKIIWWLSIDNYYFDRFLYEKSFMSLLLRGINKLSQTLLGKTYIELTKYSSNKYKKYNIINDYLVMQASINICSAHHVKQKLLIAGLNNVIYISELLNEEYLKIPWNQSLKENLVAYNPKKGIKFTRRLLRQAKGLKFVPIEGLSKVELVKLLLSVKVYIDFGNHPGRDRLPREAAILGCCVITNKRGGANLNEDLSISENYKFEETKESIQFIIKRIEDCINNYNERINDFDFYRESILNEPINFLNGLQKYFTLS